MQNWFVVVMGLGAVFVVLILIIALCWVMGLACQAGTKKEEETPAPAPVATGIPNRAALVAAVTAAVCEYSGTDASAIRILSIKKV